MTPKNLVLMDMGLFCEGMHIRSSIYSLYKGSYVLLCKDVVFTKKLINKLRQASKGIGGVYIEEDNYEEVWNESLHRFTLNSTAYEQAYQKVREDYNKVLSNTFLLLGDVIYTGTVSLRASEEISKTISDELNHVEPSLVIRCINMIGESDNYLYTHSVNVAALNGLIGRWMGLPDKQVRQLIKAGLLHDLGKLKIPPQILSKPGSLTPEEFDIIKKHPQLAYDLLERSGELSREILMAVLQHHERLNGRGYPNGLVGNEISLFGRITAVSDVYDAMVSKRCYKEASLPFEILSEFKTNRFSDLDLLVVNVFLENITYLFVGMQVQLSNGDVGEVVFVPPNNIANPVVKVGNRVRLTSEAYKCISVDRTF